MYRFDPEETRAGLAEARAAAEQAAEQLSADLSFLCLSDPGRRVLLWLRSLQPRNVQFCSDASLTAYNLGRHSVLQQLDEELRKNPEQYLKLVREELYQ
jgi:hypothetical protein